MERKSMTHDLKCWPQFFKDVIAGVKPFEVRKDDRDYQVGDRIFQWEWDPETKKETGRCVQQSITYVLRNHQPFTPEGYCIMGLLPIWIPVTVRLPADGERVFMKDGALVSAGYFVAQGAAGYFVAEIQDLEVDSESITDWMPSPAVKL